MYSPAVSRQKISGGRDGANLEVVRVRDLGLVSEIEPGVRSQIARARGEDRLGR